MFKRLLSVAFALCSVLAGALLAVAPGVALAEACPNAAFRTGPSAALPDCRAYELVSPAYTNGQGIGSRAISADGSSLIGTSLAGFAGVEGDEGPIGGYYRLTRTESGWTTTPLSLPASRFTEGEADLFAFSLDGGTFLSFARGASQPQNEIDIYADVDGSIVDLGPALPPSAPADVPPEVEVNEARLKMAGVSGDGAHVFFSLSRFFWPGDGTQFESSLDGSSLYEYVGAYNTTPMLIGVDDSGRQISQCGTVLGAGTGGEIQSSHNAVSTDGSTVFFTAYPESSECSAVAPPVAELFARVDNGLPDAHTVAISEPSKEDCSACDTESTVLAEAHFEGASADGSRVFFTTTQPLLGGDGSENIYEYDFDAPAGERIVRVSAGDSTVPAPTANVLGRVVQISEDGSHAYFVATGVLTLKPNGEGQQAQPGADNLYVVGPDPANPAQDRTAFIADLCSGLHQSGAVSDGRCPAGTHSAEGEGYDKHLWAGYGQYGSNVTPDGRFLVFLSYGDLTNDDTSSARQVFEYDAQDEKLVRVSIGQNGFNDDGNTVAGDASIVSPQYIVGQDPVQMNPLEYWGHLTVSADGSYVFFESPDGLTPQAVNNHVIAETSEFGFTRFTYSQNVYEYHEGDVSLISDGQDIGGDTRGSTVVLTGTDESGHDVFFATIDKLVGQDTNELSSIYDARIDGGFSAPSSPPACSADACQGSLSAAPTLLSPGSELQAGGNPPLAGSAPAVKAKPLTRAQKLSKALAACRKQPKSKHVACEKQARKKDGPASKGKAKKSNRRSKAKKAAARIVGRS